MKLFPRISILLVGSVAVVAACSDKDRPPASASGSSGFSSTSSSSGSSGAGDAEADGAAGEGGALSCTSSGPTTDVVQELVVRGTPPDPLGGAIAPGTYLLTELNTYQPALPGDGGDGGDESPGGGLSGFSGRGRIVLTANALQIVSARGPNGGTLPADAVTAFTFVATGTSLDATTVCPTTSAGAKKAMPYSAVGTGFALFPDATHRELYTKQ